MGNPIPIPSRLEWVRETYGSIPTPFMLLVGLFCGTCGYVTWWVILGESPAYASPTTFEMVLLFFGGAGGSLAGGILLAAGIRGVEAAI